jgi:hydrogenase maturation protease
VLVLGIGSPFGGDRLGWEAIDGLIELGLTGQFPGHLLVLEKSDRPGTLLLERMGGFDSVILIDALTGGDEPGRVRCLSLDEFDRQASLLSGHGLGVAEALALGEVLGGLPPRLLLLAIEMGTAEGCRPDAPPPELRTETLESLADQIRRWLV